MNGNPAPGPPLANAGGLFAAGRPEIRAGGKNAAYALPFVRGGGVPRGPEPPPPCAPFPYPGGETVFLPSAPLGGLGCLADAPVVEAAARLIVFDGLPLPKAYAPY